MTLGNWSALVALIVTGVGGAVAALRFIVLHYLAELKPNSGSSIKDQVNRLETRVDKIYELLISKGE